MTKQLLNIAVPNTPNRLFTYLEPEQAQRPLQPGQRVIVPFGRRRAIGYFIETATKKPEAKLRNVTEILDPQPLFDDKLIKFLKWMASYYYVNSADVFNAALPPDMRKIKKPNYIITEYFIEAADELQIPEKIRESLKKKSSLRPRDITLLEKMVPGAAEKLLDKGGIRPSWVDESGVISGLLLGYKIDSALSAEKDVSGYLDKISASDHLLNKSDIISSGISEYRFKKLLDCGAVKPVYGMPDLFAYFKPRPDIEKIKPTDEQTAAIEAITAASGKFDPFLLYGITGSGKTLVYCHAARKILERKQTVLVLVPEIALAGTLLSYFKSFFGNEIALLHSALGARERVLVWQNIKGGKYRIVIGARSAIFAPLPDLGLIIVDEEHDESYKQDDPAPRFQARDAAVMRAKLAGVPVVLGSASPSVESFYNAEQGRYRLLKLTRRPEEAAIPLVRLIDLREEPPVRDNPFFTHPLLRMIRESLDKDQQVILYLNRRGFSPRIKCTDCGHTPECPHCNISLTYHKSGNRLMCHFCGYINAGYNICAGCGGDHFVYLGTGTQKIEDQIGELVKQARVVRLDSDSASGRERAHLILSDFASKKYNLLLGTQMVTKGIDFPDVSLVGVLMADIGMDMPDFRASEKLFAKLIQVAGRSGRGIIPGEVVIQTFRPELDLIDDAARQDYESFYAREIQSRRELLYPPFSHIINFRFASVKEDAAIKQSLGFKDRLEARLSEVGLKVQILGPAPCPLYRLRGMYRRHMFVKTKSILKFIGFLGTWEQAEANYGLPSSIRLTIDIDPYDMM
ncbi:MAG: primosomal protein N' [candidate division Zixibacteria bacterium HGW-Zixibacteria-1]|nr:MAG: primosomal protein N' [candidate division Zixibacteria bacterium HGW-Zixibacteria-1]